MNEEWKPLPDFEKLCHISNLGRVKLLQRIIIEKNGKKQIRKEKIITFKLGSNHYYRFQISNENRRIHIRVHQAVMWAFHGLPNNKNTLIRHLDGNKLNNNLSNLCYGNHSENSKDGISHGTILINENRTKAKITNKEAIEICLSSESSSSLMKKYNLSKCFISRIRNGKTYATATKEARKTNPYHYKKLSKEQISHIKNCKLTQGELCKLYNLSRPTIRKIKRSKHPFYIDL